MNDVSEGWILYDGSCGLCSKWVPRWESFLGRHGFAIETLQAAWVRERLALDDEGIADLRLLLPDGRQMLGADAYRYVLRRIPLTYPLYLLSRLPLIRRIFDRCYRSVADHRHRLSRACGLENGPG